MKDFTNMFAKMNAKFGDANNTDSSTDRNPNLLGGGKIPGGQYDTIRINGMGGITGNVEAQSLNISGFGKINGSAKIDVIDANGSLSVKGDVNTTKLTSSGNTSIHGNLTAETAFLNGMFVCANTVTAKSFRLGGGLNVNASINASNIQIELNGSATVAEINGGKVSVARVPNNPNNQSILNIQSIQGDEIRIAATHTDEVRGKTVVIHAACKIETIYYTTSVQVSDDAYVGKTIKITS